MSQPVSEIDKALELVRKKPDQGHLFYDVFLNTEIIVPVQKFGQQTGTWSELPRDAKFYPLFLKLDEEKVVPIFDSLDRLKGWATQKVLDYIKLKAYLFLNIIGTDIRIAVNLGSDFSHVFAAEELNKLRAAMRVVEKRC